MIFQVVDDIKLLQIVLEHRLVRSGSTTKPHSWSAIIKSFEAWVTTRYGRDRALTSWPRNIARRVRMLVDRWNGGMLGNLKQTKASKELVAQRNSLIQRVAVMFNSNHSIETPPQSPQRNHNGMNSTDDSNESNSLIESNNTITAIQEMERRINALDKENEWLQKENIQLRKRLNAILKVIQLTKYQQSATIHYLSTYMVHKQ